MCLIGVHLNAELLCSARDSIPCLLSLPFRLAEDNKVVRISDEAEARFIELPVQVIEYDVSQKRRYNTALGCTDRDRFEYTVLHDTGREKSLDSAENVAVRNLGRRQ